MTAVDDILGTGPPNPIKNGRYWLPDPNGKPTYWTRATTIAKLLDDTYRITQSDRRKVAIGVARTPSIAAAVCADHDNNTRLDQLCEQAITVAGGTEKRDLGTALHRLCERWDRQELDYDGEWSDHINCYTETLKHHRLTVRPEWCETVLVNTTYQIAGTVDRLLEDPEGRLVVADLKTGGYRSWLAWATQFAIYATSTHWWDPESNTLKPLPEIRQDHTLAVHLPAQETPPHCQIHALSVPLGLDALLMALEVRRTRALDKLPQLQATTYHPPQLLDQLEQSIADTFDVAQIRADIQARIDRLKNDHVEAARALIARWPDGVEYLKRSDTHTPQQLTAIDRALTKVEADYSIPF